MVGFLIDYYSLQAAEEFLAQARNTERRWSRALQHEHSLRLQLQENMEALANQMHGLEDEARLSVQGPSLHAVSSPGSVVASVGSSTSEIAGPSPDALKTTESVREKMPSEMYRSPDQNDYFEGGYESEDEDEDKFFDAPEMSPEDVVKSKDATDQMASPSSSNSKLPSLPPGHRRSFSTTSVNDTSSMKQASGQDVTEKLPQVSSDRRMAVSVTPPLLC